ncbi:TPA: TIGR03756 family integrating conjugative element protein [Vibrio vulnificus]|nr:TIGR03756 family integrating conjugative element protein [Vibrio vulnificus]
MIRTVMFFLVIMIHSNAWSSVGAGGPGAGGGGRPPENYLPPLPDTPTCEPWPDCWTSVNWTEKYIEDKKNNPEITSPGSITTTSIMSNSISMSCLNWQVVGGCFWYTFPYKVSFSIRVKHYIPDYVVSVYAESEENPWDLMSWQDIPGSALVRAIVGFDSGGGGTYGKGKSDQSTNVRFKHATVIGNPLASFWGSMGFGFFLCDSEAMSFIPAYNSNLDGLLWRVHPIEGIYGMTQILTNQHRIAPPYASFLEKWGFTYPRTGFVIGVEDLKVATVAAVRASSIATSTGVAAFAHIANPPSMQNSSGYRPAKSLVVNGSRYDQGKFQMLLPKTEPGCRIITDMGTRIPDSLTPWKSRNGKYAWNFWRPYTCCRRKGKKLIFEF